MAGVFSWKAEHPALPFFSEVCCRSWEIILRRTAGSRGNHASPRRLRTSWQRYSTPYFSAASSIR